MSLRPSRRFLIIAGALVISAAWLLARDTGTDDPTLVARATQGEFTVVVRTAGELGARESMEIMAPAGARQVQVYQMRISSLVPEGTVVDSGDVVAELDRSEMAAKQSEAMLALEKAEAVYEQAMLDSALTLSQAREDIRSRELELEEARLEKEQSVYEPPTVQRQAEINLERADRALAQGRADYATKTEQSRAKMREVGADVERERNSADLPAAARLAVRTAVLGGKIYAVGGTADHVSVLPTVEAYDPVTDTWEAKADMPFGRALMAVEAVGGRLYAIGGGSSPNSDQGQALVYDPATDSWSAVTSMPTGRSSVCSGFVGGRIRVIGGASGNTVFGTLESYDPDADTWTSGPSMKVARWALSCGVVGGKLYAIGGATKVAVPHPGTRTAEVFDPAA